METVTLVAQLTVVERPGSVEHCTQPVDTNCWYHLKIIVIFRRLPVMWIVLMHNMMRGMKQVFQDFRQNMSCGGRPRQGDVSTK